MKFRTKALWALGLACALAGPAYSAVIAPTAEMWIGAQKYPVPVTTLPDGSYAVDNWEGTYPEARVTISGRLKPDPNISYGLSVTDFGAPSSFSFTFTTPIIATGFPNVVNGSIVGGLTDSSGDGVSITPTQPNMDADGIPELQTSSVGLPVTNMGVDVGLGLSFPAGPPGALYNYGSFASGPLAGPGPGPWTQLSVTTAFTLSGNGDIAALTGFASVEVPEPGMATLLLAGVPALLRRRRK